MSDAITRHPREGFAGLPYDQQPSNVGGQRKCPTCKGTGINPVWQSKVCPKCNGERVVGPRRG